MPIRQRRDWELKEHEITPEGVFHGRRALLKTMGMGGLIAGASPLLAACEDAPPPVVEDDPSKSLYPVARNDKYTLDRELTPRALPPNTIIFTSSGPIRISGGRPRPCPSGPGP